MSFCCAFVIYIIIIFLNKYVLYIFYNQFSSSWYFKWWESRNIALPTTHTHAHSFSQL